MDIHLLLVDGSNVSLLYTKTKKAMEWIEHNLGCDYQIFAKGIVVDKEFVQPILKGLHQSNLSYLIQRS